MTSGSITSTNNNMIVVPIKKEFEYEEVEMEEHLPHHSQQPTPTSTKPADINPVPVTQSQPVLDLREWKGHRVLAKRESVYMQKYLVNLGAGTNVKGVEGKCPFLVSFVLLLSFILSS